MKKIISLILITIILTGCSSQNTSKPISQTDFYFDTVVTITLYDTNDTAILDECFNICNKYENLFSKTIETSDIAILNRDKILENADTDTVNIISKAQYYSELTNGKFDITVSKLSDLWNFTGENPKVPIESDILNALSGVNYNNITINNNTISISDPNTSVDLGGIAKGYIADRIKEYLLSVNVKSALIDLGGNILLVGEKPDKQAFSVGLQKPFAQRNETVAVVNAKDISIVSSGSYERYFYENDKLYHHILDTNSGYPVDNGLVSVTILSESSSDGDALSTSCFALGPKEGLALIESLDGIEAIFIDEDKKITLSSGLKIENNVISFLSNK